MNFLLPCSGRRARGRYASLTLLLGLAACFGPGEDGAADGSTGTSGGTTTGSAGPTSATSSSSATGGPTSTTAGPTTAGPTSATAGPTTSTATTEGSTSEGSTDTSTGEDDSSSTGDTGSSGDESSSSSTGVEQVCDPGAVIGCDGADLVTCNDDGTAEESSTCLLGCNQAELRCNDVDPSNGLGPQLDIASDEPELDLGGSATINTDTGVVNVDGVEVTVTSELVDATPDVRVFSVGGLVTGDVTVSGTAALAIVSDGDIQIGGHFSVSASGISTPGPGALNNAACQGEDYSTLPQTLSGAGGGGFGTPGGFGGAATNQGTANGGDGGATTGNPTLVPLRGGCDSGNYGAGLRGRGGGAVQLVSRTEIAVQGILSANGTSASGGGSGGGILLEAPEVFISGNMVANGAGGAGGGFIPLAGEDGRTDAQPAQGGAPADTNAGDGGTGAAGSIGAMPGESLNQPNLVFGGHGGGGAGRLRVNTLDGDGLTQSGIVSPNPTTGDLGIQ